MQNKSTVGYTYNGSAHIFTLFGWGNLRLPKNSEMIKFKIIKQWVTCILSKFISLIQTKSYMSTIMFVGYSKTIFERRILLISNTWYITRDI